MVLNYDKIIINLFARKLQERLNCKLFRYPKLTWSIVGNMQVARQGHAAIYHEGMFYVVGGGKDKINESCSLNRESPE